MMELQKQVLSSSHVTIKKIWSPGCRTVERSKGCTRHSSVVSKISKNPKIEFIAAKRVFFPYSFTGPDFIGSSKLQRIHFFCELLITIQKHTQRNGSSSSCCNFGNTTTIHASISTTRSRTPVRTDHLSEQEHPRGKNQSRRSRDDA